MYIDKFHFSPFKINKNVVSVWHGAGSFTVKDGKIFQGKKEVTPEEFYDLFVSIAKDTWFVKDFIRFFDKKKKAIPNFIGPFAVYCDCKFTFLSEDI